MKAFFLSLKEDTPTSGYWDYAILEELLAGFEWEDIRSLPESGSCVVVIPGRSHAQLIDQVNAELKKVSRAVLFIMGDEEHDFPIEELTHKQLTIWVQNPNPGRHDAYHKLGCGYTPHVYHFSGDLPTKSVNFFFAGQITHSRRLGLAQTLKNKDGILIETAGFTQGLSQTDYAQQLSQARVAPCPSGPETPDTFRLYEALELGCVPVADEVTPKEAIVGYWDWLFGEKVPFPTFTQFKDLLSKVNVAASQFPSMNNQTQAWWYRKKQQMKAQIKFDAMLQAADPREDITVIIPISPISSHPDTAVLEETVSTIRYHLPKAEIVLTFDGVRKEQEDLYNAYQEHIRRVLWLCRTWKNVTPYIFDEHTHQVGMARVALEHVTTPLILYVEQDTPLVIDEPIEWESLINTLLFGDANVIRFHFEGVIPEPHLHLMIDDPKDNLLKTVQWSQRPHLARTDFYAKMLADNFSSHAKCFIEDRIHGKVQDAWNVEGMKGWEKWKIFIYHPMTGNIKRSYHTDGRHGEQKFDGKQVW